MVWTPVVGISRYSFVIIYVLGMISTNYVFSIILKCIYWIRTDLILNDWIVKWCYDMSSTEILYYIKVLFSPHILLLDVL